MILMDIPMPESCEDCPCSYWIRSGEQEGRLMCSAIEFREQEIVLVDEGKPARCPIRGEIREEDGVFHYLLKE